MSDAGLPAEFISAPRRGDTPVVGDDKHTDQAKLRIKAANDALAAGAARVKMADADD
jgi:hypothetical protein